MELLGFKKWYQTIKLYRGKKVDDEEEDSNRLSGLFKVSAQNLLYHCSHNLKKSPQELREVLVLATGLFLI